MTYNNKMTHRSVSFVEVIRKFHLIKRRFCSAINIIWNNIFAVFFSAVHLS